MSTTTTTNTESPSPASPRLVRAAVQLPSSLMERVERARSRAALGSARPSVAAVLRAAVELGLPALLGADVEAAAGGSEAA